MNDSRKDDEAFQHALARENFIEDFLTRIEQRMVSLQMDRVQLAKAMNCSPANVTRLMKNTANLTAGKMVDMARAVGLKMRVIPRLIPSATSSAESQNETVSDRFVRVEPAAAAVQRSTFTIRALVKAGKLPAVRSGNLLLVDIDALRAIYAPRPTR